MKEMRADTKKAAIVLGQVCAPLQHRLDLKVHLHQSASLLPQLNQAVHTLRVLMYTWQGDNDSSTIASIPEARADHV